MKAKFLFLQVGMLVAVLGLTISCTKAPSDTQVTSDIQSKIGGDSGLQGKQISVQAANGAVRISGTVDSDAQSEAAAKYAASEPGVKQVINNLQVTGMASTAAPAAEPEPAPAETTPARPSKPSPSAKARHHRSESQDQMAQSAAPQRPADAPFQPAPPQQAASAPPPAPPEPQKVTVPSGTALPVRLVDTIDSATAQTGDTFHATLDAPIAVDGDVVIPAHYEVEGHVVNAQASGKFAGRALLTLQLDRIKVGDRYYNIQTDQFSQQTGSRGKNTAAKVGGGAVAGA